VKVGSEYSPTAKKESDSQNDTLITVSLASGKLCLLSFNMTSQQTPVENYGGIDEKQQPGSAANRSKQPKLGERSLIEHPTVFSIQVLHPKVNKDSRPLLVQSDDRTVYVATNDGTLMQCQIELKVGVINSSEQVTD
jgi:hypothetical protein